MMLKQPSTTPSPFLPPTISLGQTKWRIEVCVANDGVIDNAADIIYFRKSTKMVYNVTELNFTRTQLKFNKK